MSYAGYGRAATEQEVRSKKGHTEEELIQCTLKTLTETDEIANKTLDTLNHQDEQIRTIKECTNTTDHNIKQSEKLLKQLGPFGWVSSVFGTDKGRSGRRVAPPPRESVPSQGSLGRPASGAARIQQEAERRRVAASAPKAKDGDDKDKKLDQIGGLLDGLMVKTKQMNVTLSKHNEELPEITSVITRQQECIDRQSKEIQRRMM